MAVRSRCTMPMCRINLTVFIFSTACILSILLLLQPSVDYERVPVPIIQTLALDVGVPPTCTENKVEVSTFEESWHSIQQALLDEQARRDPKDGARSSLVAAAAEPTSIGLTSASTSTFELVSPSDPRVGDTLHFHITARDESGRTRSFGGDFWFGVLQSPTSRDKNKNTLAATSARIADHRNGTYSMYFVAAWSGQVEVKVTLVHPSESIHYLRTSFRHEERKVIWKGVFLSKNVTEKSKCWIEYGGNWTNTCEYRPQRALRKTRLICDPTPSLRCDSLVGVYGATSYSYQFNRVLPEDKQYLFQKSNVNVQLKAGKKITVKGAPSLVPNQLDIPTCKPDLQPGITDGFWYDNNWTSLVCKPLIQFTNQNLRRCLRDQHVYLTGDSTTRQWFAEIAKTLGMSRKEDNQFKNKSFYLARRDEKDNIDLKFIFHPLSLHPSTVFVDISVVQFEADVIADLARDTCNHIVVISPWAHFPNYPWGSYVDWLEGIRDAYLLAKIRCPNLKFVVKTPHPVNMQWEMKARDWMFYQMKRQMWKTFRGTGAIFVDTWDMNLSYPSAPINMHMPDDVVRAEVSLFLSHVCSR